MADTPLMISNDAAVAAARMLRQRAQRFHLAGVFLPRNKRNAAYVVAAFCGMISQVIVPSDDSSESCCSTGSVDSNVALMRDRLNEIYEDRLDLPEPPHRSPEQHVMGALGPIVRRQQIPKQHFLDFLEGIQFDHATSRYATWTALEKQCYRSSGVVALMMSCVLGLTHSESGAHAVSLGNAIRLTDILLNLKADLVRGKVYLPLEDMAKHRYSERDLAAGVVNDGFRELMRFEVARARGLYRDASEGLCWLGDDGSRMAVSVVAVRQAGMLSAIERRGWNVLGPPMRLGVSGGLTRAHRAWKLARRAPGEPLPDVIV